MAILPQEKEIPPRVATPTLLQMEAVECGAACLGIIQRSYGLWLPLEQLRQECGVTRDGSKASNLLKAARRFGLQASGIRYELESLLRAEPPLILFWNFNHFVVYEGIADQKVHLNDPATGPRRISLDELEAAFTGVTLCLRPGAAFHAGGQRPSLLRALSRRVTGIQLGLIFAFVAGLLLVIPNIVNPSFTRTFVDRFLIDDSAEILRPMLTAMGCSILFMLILLSLQQHFLLRLQTKLALSTSAKFLNHILRLPIEFFSQRLAGDIDSRVLINDRVAKVLSEKLVGTLLEMVSLVFFTFLLFWYDIWLTIICVLLTLVNIVAVKAVQRQRVDASARLLQERCKLIGTSANGIQMIDSLKASGGETEFFGRWAGYQAKMIKAYQDLDMYGQCLGAVPPFTKGLISAAILGLGGLRIMDGHITVGLLVAYQAMMDNFTRPIVSFVNFGNALQETQSDLNRLDDVLDNPKAQPVAPTVAAEDAKLKLAGQIELRGVSFGFNPLAPPLIEELDLTIRPGDRIALVGGSGSGKSTISKLIAGIYVPWAGEILFDGMDRRDLPGPLLYNSLGIVDQDICLFEGSVRENLAMWDTTTPDAQIIQACKDALIADVLAERPGGYLSRIAENGINFSGGQRQRLEIARALVNSPSFLILDEATSSLDPITERQIIQNIRRRGCSCLLIAHRLSTIKDCDEILVLEKGKVVERGTHEEMKNADGPYARLIKL
jgi:ATP-binding cassette, subfamily C, bacterial